MRGPLLNLLSCLLLSSFGIICGAGRHPDATTPVLRPGQSCTGQVTKSLTSVMPTPCATTVGAIPGLRRADCAAEMGEQ